MYQIIVEGEIKALCDAPRYVKTNKNSGAFVQTVSTSAEGVAVGNEIFNLNGKEVIEGAKTAIIREVDGGEVTFSQKAKIDDNEVKIAETEETALAGLTGITDLYEELLDKGVL